MKKKLLLFCVVSGAFLVLSSCSLNDLLGNVSDSVLSSSTDYWENLLDISGAVFTNPSGRITGLRGKLMDFSRCSKITLSKKSSSVYSLCLYISENNQSTLDFTMTDGSHGYYTEKDFDITVNLTLKQSGSSTLTISKGSESIVFTMQEIEL